MRERIRSFLKISGQKSVYLYSVVVGMLSGLMAGIFMLLLEKSSEYIQYITSDLFLSHRISSDGMNIEWSSKLLLIIFLPALGGLLTGLLVHFLCREASGMGTDSMIYA
ncbi:MAG TPA: chloride channel protein, partial [Leptospiraceae bacterium]|nr:chloride channel protein [Leptospiraceae bacterium]